MFPLIYLNDTDYFASFELRKAKKAIIDCLKYSNKNYSLKIKDNIFDFVHFFSINDVASFLLEKGDNSDLKYVISILSFENSYKDNYLEVNENKDKQEVILSKNNVQLVNKCDCILVPSFHAIKLLQDNGVESKIKVFNFYTKGVEFDLTDDIMKDLIFRYLFIKKGSYIITIFIQANDDEVYERIKILSENFKSIKFVVVYEEKKSSLSRKLRNKTKIKENDNIVFVKNIEEDLYISLMFNSKVLLLLNSLYSSDLEILDAYSSKTQVIGLKGAAFEDLIIDKKTAYIYNNLDDLLISLKQYIEGFLPSTIEEGIKFSKKYSLAEQSKKLINIYSEVMGEEYVGS